MSWGTYWMFYECPKCAKKFKYSLEVASRKDFGLCPVCKTEGRLVFESRDNIKNEHDYEDAGW